MGGGGVKEEQHVTADQPFLARQGCVANGNNVFSSPQRHSRHTADGHVHAATLTLQFSRDNRRSPISRRGQTQASGLRLNAGSRDV